jgi:hypothetical protein
MSITIRGLENLYKKLGAAAATKILEPPMNRAVLRIQRDMQAYPPSPPNSSYRRTGTYGRRWTVKVSRSGNGLSGTIGNNTRYGPLVGSRMFQTSAHRRTGWETDARAVATNEGAIVADFQSAVDRALAS